MTETKHNEYLTGGCLCGKVTYQVNNIPHLLHFCHCEQCRKLNGTAHASNMPIDPDGFQWTSGKEYLKRYDVPGRSFTNVFCTECGSNLPFLNVSKTTVYVTAGTLDREPLLKETNNIFCGEQPRWSKQINTSENHDSFPPSYD